MEYDELLRRAEDLRERCERTGSVTSTGFLRPAERRQMELWSRRTADCRLLFHGGGADCERCVGFFLPYYAEPEDFSPDEYIRAIKLTARFGSPGHREVFGALLGMGVGREWVGDIRLDGETAWVFCLPSVQRHLLSLDKVGRWGVKAEPIALAEVPPPQRQVKEKSFSVQSPRLDAVVAGMFNLSRTEAARKIAAGGVSLNYEETLKTDAAVHEGDIVSLRGAGKGKVTGTGGASRKGRLFVYAEIYK